YGYYVLPLLVDDQIVGRIDAKTDRAANTFRVLGAWAENGVKIEDVADRIRPALQEFARFVGVDQLEIVDRGDLAPALRAIRG
ncbi:MAG: winged helix-turn-helix domain-containing protein, partial [Acidimicrobiales bacterium]